MSDHGATANEGSAVSVCRGEEKMGSDALEAMDIQIDG
jgi:hypothetical protein